MKILTKLKLLAVIAAIGVLNLALPLTARAAVTSPASTARVSFTFDDGYASALTQAAPALTKYGITGTDYVITGCVGMTVVPNTCHADNDKSYMTWAQIAQLKTMGWEIGSHTATHPYLATSDPDDQPLPISASQVTTELTQSRDVLKANGITATDFATPYGDYNLPVLAEIAKYYDSQRGFGDVGTNTWPNSDYFLKVKQVQGNVTVKQMQTAIDQAIAANQWLILVFHDINTKPSKQATDYEYATKDLEEVAKYVQTKKTAGQLQSVNINHGLVTSDVNLLANSSFNSAISYTPGTPNSWSTDSPVSTVAKDAGNHGSYPDPINSMKLSAITGKDLHLFSPKVGVDPNATYMFKSFLNVVSKTGVAAGGVGYYVDEYDAAGNWISGQRKSLEPNVFVEKINFSYKPTSALVSKAALQVYVSAGTGITAYVDNFQMFPLTIVSIPPPQPQTDLMVNGTFDGGISGGWTTNSAATIVADSTNNGSPANSVNSVKMTSSASNRHLFSPLIAVDSTLNYTLTSYLNITQRTSGEIGYYIDEYDANGSWISGQWKTGVLTLGAGNVALQYKPSSINVKKASLQIIIVGNSGITAYFDDVHWYKP